MRNLVRLLALGAVVAASSSFALADSVTVSGADQFSTSTTPSATDPNPGITFLNYMGGTTNPQGSVASVQGPGTEFDPYLFSIVNLTSFSYADADGTTVFQNADDTFSFTITDMQTTSFGTDSHGATLTLAGLGSFDLGGTTLPGSFSLTSSTSNGTDFSFQLINSPVSPAPEPNSLLLMGTGLMAAAGLLFMRRRNASNLA